MTKPHLGTFLTYLKTSEREGAHELAEAVIRRAKVLSGGARDKYIFKAIFLAGGPGSGKSYITEKHIKRDSLKIINSDIVFEKLMRDARMDLKLSDSDEALSLRERAKYVMKVKKLKLLTTRRLGIIIDGTGKDAQKIEKASNHLRSLGYSTAMVFVDTSLEVALERNRQRSRTVAEPKVIRMWEAVQKNKDRFKRMFFPDFHLVENNTDARDLNKISKEIDKFLRWPLNPQAQRWVENELRYREIVTIYEHVTTLQDYELDGFWELDDDDKLEYLKRWDYGEGGEWFEEVPQGQWASAHYTDDYVLVYDDIANTASLYGILKNVDLSVI